MCFVSEINEEKVALCSNVKQAPRHPSFSTKVTAFVIQGQEPWARQPRHADHMLATSVGGTVAPPLSPKPLIHSWDRPPVEDGEGHSAVVVTVHGGDNVTTSRVFSCF